MIRTTKGFSLAETVVVVAIISLLGTVSVSTYGAYRNQAEVSTVQAELLQLVETAKHQARTGVENSSWSLELETDRLTLFGGDDFASRDQSFDRVLTLPSGVSLAGPEKLTFASVTGYPDAASTYSLVAGTDTMEVSINAYGTIERQ